MLESPSVVTSEGDIRIHNQAGFTLTLEFRDDAGVFRNMTGVVVKWDTDFAISKTLTSGAEVYQKVLTVTKEELEVALNKPASFICYEVVGGQPDPIWSGRLFVGGWA